MDSDMNFIKELLNLNLIKEEEFEKIKEITQHSFDCHSTDAPETTLLHYSVQSKNENLMKYLLDEDIDVNIQDSSGTTALMLAVMENCESLIKILLVAGADMFTVNHEKNSTFDILIAQNTMNFDVVELILRELKKKISTSKDIAKKLIEIGCPLYFAIVLKDATIIEYMIEHGCQVNFAHPIDKITALHVAVSLEDLEGVRVLLKYGANVNALNSINENPLYNLYKKDKNHNRAKIRILKMLVERGVSMMSCTSDGVFQAYWILNRGNDAAIDILFNSTLDFNVTDEKNTQSALHYLVSNVYVGIIVEMLKFHIKKFNINARDKFGQTPLFIATCLGNVTMVKFLLEQGAKTNIRHNILDTTALYHAYERSIRGCQNQYYECGELLLRYGANPQIVAVQRTGEVSTIFDAALKRNDISQLMPLVAHLAMLKKLGTPITEMTMNKINSNHSLKHHFNKCYELLTERVSERVVLFDLLTKNNKKKMARYLNNKNIVRKLQDKSYKSKIKFYNYYDVFLRRFSKGLRYKKLKNEAAEILCKIFKHRIDESHIVIDKITDYLDDQGLEQLCRVYL